MSQRLTAALIAASTLCSIAAAQPVQQIVVTGSLAERNAAEAPYAIGLVDRETLRSAGPLVNLSEAMARVPGLVVNNRWNYAQDLQISSRGFGARAGFGVRGVRLVADGIPASGPDGQGQVTHFDLAGAARVEVLRGPFSVLYGNSSGGVIALIGADAERREAEVGFDVGSFGQRQARASLALPLGDGWSLRAGAAAFEVEGFRPHSQARRRLANARLAWQGASDRVVVIASHLDQPAQDPLGLTRAQIAADAYQTAPQAAQFDTRKTARQSQLGASWRHRFDAGVLRETNVAAYAGTRAVTQFLAIAPAVQAGARHGGGVIDFERDFGGIDARARLVAGDLAAQLGVAIDRQRDDRRGYENFTGSGAGQRLGVVGRLRRDETNDARSRDVYAQAEWSARPDLDVSGGVRVGRLALAARDAYLANGDDSGRLDYDYTNPVLGVRWQLTPQFNVHASAARGYESPTLGELAYRPSGEGGLNAALKAQTSRQFELGAKWRGGAAAVDVVVFDIRVDDELGVATNAGGRASFQNVGRTLRRGAELSASWRPGAAWRGALALTWLDATYRDSFLTCAGIPCSAPTVRVPAGNRIAGTQRASAFAELAWRSAALGEFGAEWRAVGRTAVNDTNSDFATGYGVAALRWSRSFTLWQGTKAELLLRVDNVADRVHVGSVIVNEANQRFFETGAPRSVLLAIRVAGG